MHLMYELRTRGQRWIGQLPDVSLFLHCPFLDTIYVLRMLGTIIYLYECMFDVELRLFADAVIYMKML